jgi:hypothetical protein
VQLLDNNSSGATSFQGYVYSLIGAKKGLGQILSDFFKNSSGHPA